MQPGPAPSSPHALPRASRRLDPADGAQGRGTQQAPSRQAAPGRSGASQGAGFPVTGLLLSLGSHSALPIKACLFL